jgi:hypothetical protein
VNVRSQTHHRPGPWAGGAASLAVIVDPAAGSRLGHHP